MKSKIIILLIILSVLSLELSAQHFAPVFLHPVRVDKEYYTHGIYAGVYLKSNKIRSNGIHASLMSTGNYIVANGIHSNLLCAEDKIKANVIHASLISYWNEIYSNGIHASLISMRDINIVNGIHASLISIGNGIKVNGIHASLFSAGNNIYVNGIHASVISIANDIQGKGIYANLISINDVVIEVNGLHINMINIGHSGISLINTYLNLPTLPRISFSAFRMGVQRGYYLSCNSLPNSYNPSSRFFLDLGLANFMISLKKVGISVGLIASSSHPSYINIGILNYNHFAPVRITPLIGWSMQDKRTNRAERRCKGRGF